MLKKAERLGFRILSGKSGEDRGYPQEHERSLIEAKGADYWARLHVRGDRRPMFDWLRPRSNHHEIRLTK